MLFQCSESSPVTETLLIVIWKLAVGFLGKIQGQRPKAREPCECLKPLVAAAVDHKTHFPGLGHANCQCAKSRSIAEPKSSSRWSERDVKELSDFVMPSEGKDKTG